MYLPEAFLLGYLYWKIFLADLLAWQNNHRICTKNTLDVNIDELKQIISSIRVAQQALVKNIFFILTCSIMTMFQNEKNK